MTDALTQAVDEAMDKAIESLEPVAKNIALDEQQHLVGLVDAEQAANVVLQASQAFQAAQMAAGSRSGFMNFLSKRYRLGPRDSIKLDGTITRAAPVVQVEASNAV